MQGRVGRVAMHRSGCRQATRRDHSSNGRFSWAPIICDDRLRNNDASKGFGSLVLWSGFISAGDPEAGGRAAIEIVRLPTSGQEMIGGDAMRPAGIVAGNVVRAPRLQRPA